MRYFLLFLALTSCASSPPRAGSGQPHAATTEPDLSAREADGLPSLCARYTEFLRACVADQELGLRLDVQRTAGLLEDQWREQAYDEESTRQVNQECSDLMLSDRVSMASICPELVRR